MLFSYALHIYFVYQENMHILQLIRFVLIAHELCQFEKNIVLNTYCADMHENTYKIICIVWHGTLVRAIVMAMYLLYMLTLWSKCVLYGALDPLVLWPQCNHCQWYSHYKTDVISRCGPLGVGLDRAANVTYGMFRAMDGPWHCTTSPSEQHQPC